MRKLISISLLLITTLIFGQSPMIGLVSNASIANPTGVAVLSNFRVENLTPTLVHFDASASISGLLVTGFKIEGILINSITIDGDNLGGYFTLSASLNFWDNNTIRKEGGDNSVIYDFDLEYIENNINEPTSTTQILYAGATSQGSANGSDDANRMTYQAAITAASAGTTIWAKAGTTSTGLNFGGAVGTELNPIKFIGYKTNTSDAAELTRTTGMSFNAAEMPLVDGHSGDAINLSGSSYIIMKNFQISGGTTSQSSGVYLDANNTQFIHLENYYIDGNGNEYGVRAKDSDDNGHTNIRSKRAYIANCEQQGITVCKNFNLIDDNYVCSSANVGMDYYISVNGGETVGDGNNIVRNCYVERFAGDSQVGHGISIKVGHKYSAQDIIVVEKYLTQCLIENNEIWNCAQSLEAKHFNCHNNVYRGNVIDDDTGTNHAGGIMITNGAYENIFINNLCQNGDYGIQLSASTEDDLAPDAGRANKFINCIFKDNNQGVYMREDNQGDSRIPYDNEAINCNFDGNTVLLYAETNDLIGDENTFKNCIITNNLNDEGTANNSGWTYEYCDFWNNTSFTVPSGDGNFEVDPDLNASYQPQADFSTIDVPRIDGVYYGKNGNERQDDTTVGAVLHADETP